MLKNITKIASSHIVVKALGLANIGLILHFFSVKEFGAYSFLLVLLHLVAVIIDPFLSAYLVDFKTYDFKKFNIGILTLSLILAPFLFVLLNQINTEVSLGLFLLFMGTFLIATSLKTYLNIKEYYYRYGLVDVMRQLSIFGSTLLFFYVLKMRDYTSLLLINYATSAIVMLVACFAFVKKGLLEFNIQGSTLQKFTKESKFLIAYVAIVPLMAFIDSFFVEKYLTAQDLGLYSFSLKVYNISLLLAVPVFTVLNIKQIAIAKEKEYTAFLNKNKRKVVLFSLLIFSGSVFLNWLLTQYVFPAYSDSFIDTTILLAAACISYVAMPFSFLIAYRRYKWLFALAVFAVLVNSAVNYFWIATYGTVVAATATFMAQLILTMGAAIVSYVLLYNKEAT